MSVNQSTLLKNISVEDCSKISGGVLAISTNPPKIQLSNSSATLSGTPPSASAASAASPASGTGLCSRVHLERELDDD
jgi:hypothetical protein